MTELIFFIVLSAFLLGCLAIAWKINRLMLGTVSVGLIIFGLFILVFGIEQITGESINQIIIQGLQ